LLSLLLQVKPHYAFKDIRISYAVGISAGILIATCWTMCAYFKPPLAPLWGYYNALGTALPFVGFINAHLLKFLQYCASFGFGLIVLNYITDYGRKYRAGAAALCIIAGLSFSGFESIDMISYWLISGIALGLVLFIIWYYLLRFSLEGVCIALATCFFLTIVQQLYFNIVPNIFVTGSFAIACIIVFTAYLFKQIRKLYADA